MSGWSNFTEESFDSKDCTCSQLENHADCAIHGHAPYGGRLAAQYLMPASCTEEEEKEAHVAEGRRIL